MRNRWWHTVTSTMMGPAPARIPMTKHMNVMYVWRCSINTAVGGNIKSAIQVIIVSYIHTHACTNTRTRTHEMHRIQIPSTKISWQIFLILGERAYKCYICEKTFTQQANLHRVCIVLRVYRSLVIYCIKYNSEFHFSICTCTRERSRTAVHFVTNDSRRLLIWLSTK